MRRKATAIALMLGMWAASAASAQDTKMQPFEPTKEHQLLKQFDGEWTYVNKCSMPGQPPLEGNGNETARHGYGSFWLTLEDRGMVKGKEFNGTGLIGYDPLRSKYVGVWADNMTPFLGRFEGKAEADGKTFNFTFLHDQKTPKGDMPCPERMVMTFKDKDTRVLEFYGKDDSGKESVWSTITYTRKPAIVK